MSDTILDEEKPNSRVALGQMFKSKRESLLLDHKTVANKLRVLPQTIKGLETADYSTMKAEVFIRGYIRSYASLLELDIDQCLQMYGHSETAANPIHTNEPPKLAEKDGLDTMIKLGLPVLFVIFAWFGYRFFLGGESHFLPDNINNDKVVVEEFDIDPSASLEQQQISLPETLDQRIADNDLVVQFTGSSAISIADDNGRLLVDDELKRKGDVLVFNGGSFYTLLIGYSANVKVYYQGEAIKLAYSIENPVVKLDVGKDK